MEKVSVKLVVFKQKTIHEEGGVLWLLSGIKCISRYGLF